MKTGYWISEDAFDTLVRAHSALNMLATLLYETENSKARPHCKPLTWPLWFLSLPMV